MPSSKTITAAFPAGDNVVFASALEWELIDVAAADQVISIGGGVAKAIYCEVAGEVLTIDTDLTTNKATPTLQEGMNPWSCTRVYKTGTVTTGNVYAVTW